MSKLNDMIVHDMIRDVSHWKSGPYLAIIRFTGLKAFEEHRAVGLNEVCCFIRLIILY